MNQVVPLRAQGMLDVMGPLIEFVTPPAGDDGYCVLRAIVPENTIVPVHSHPDRETMVILDGQLEGLLAGTWRRYGPGETMDIAADAPHAFRNTSGRAVRLLLVTTGRMGRFFSEIGRDAETLVPGPPSPDRLGHFVATAARYGYWLGAEQDNAAVGLSLGPPGADAPR
jgi:quercetin dioxygenase-like cupin family protein